jgi:hypothetical protein
MRQTNPEDLEEPRAILQAEGGDFVVEWQLAGSSHELADESCTDSRDIPALVLLVSTERQR